MEVEESAWWDEKLRGVREAAGGATEAKQAADVQEVGPFFGGHDTRRRVFPDAALKVHASAQLERMRRQVHEHHLLSE